MSLSHPYFDMFSDGHLFFVTLCVKQWDCHSFLIDGDILESIGYVTSHKCKHVIRWGGICKVDNLFQLT